MKIIVTGATGFIGRYMVDALLAAGHQVTCISRRNIDENLFLKPVSTIICDFKEPETIKEHMEDADAVIHMAAQLGHYGIPYDDYYRINYMSTARLIEASQQHGVKQFIYCSAPFVTGLEGRLVREDAPYAPPNPYAETKMMAEKAVMELCSKNMAYTILRPSFVYGAGDERRTALYRAIKKKHFVLTTSGTSYIHPTYVTDIVDGFMLCLFNEKAYNQIFNLAAEKDCTSKEYLQCIARHTESRLLQLNIGYGLSVFLADIVDGISKKLWKKAGFVNHGRIDFLAKDHSCSIEKARAILGYEPKVTLEEGIKRSVLWSKHNGYL